MAASQILATGNAQHHDSIDVLRRHCHAEAHVPVVDHDFPFRALVASVQRHERCIQSRQEELALSISDAARSSIPMKVHTYTVTAAMRDSLKSSPFAGPAFGSMTESSGHRDELLRGEGVYK